MTAPQVNFKKWINEKGLATASDKEMEDEQERRKLYDNPFPLDVFNPKIHPYLNALHNEYDLPRSYIGLGMLSAYSSAIGSAYHVRINRIGDIYFPVWACLEGISSAGKSLVMNQIFKPLYNIQNEIEEEWFASVQGKTDDAIQKMPSKQLIYGEAHIPTLIKDVMPSNPKGVLQDADEILSWINGMNQLSKGSKEGTDEQFWMKSWNCKPHRKRLSGNKQFVIKKPFLNVFGGAQPSIMWKLFRNDRATTGFIFRLLFAVPEVHKIAEPNLLFDMPEEYERIHEKCLNALYHGLPMWDGIESRPMVIEPKGIHLIDHWAKGKNREVTESQDIYMKEMLSGILGKIKEYIIRFSGILHMVDLAYNNEPFGHHEVIRQDTVERAIRLGNYFYKSAKIISEKVNTNIIATPEVIRYSVYVRAGYSYQQIGDKEFMEITNQDTRRIKAARMVKKYIQEYPKVFGAEVKT
jgi:hypothetical protein